MAKNKATAPVTISREDWLAATAEAQADRADNDPGLLSYYDYAALMQVSLGTAVKRMNVLAAAGRAIRTTKRTLTPDGRIRTVVAFRLKK
jgi:hypothetical protein